MICHPTLLLPSSPSWIQFLASHSPPSFLPSLDLTPGSATPPSIFFSPRIDPTPGSATSPYFFLPLLLLSPSPPWIPLKDMPPHPRFPLSPPWIQPKDLLFNPPSFPSPPRIPFRVCYLTFLFPLLPSLDPTPGSAIPPSFFPSPLLASHPRICYSTFIVPFSPPWIQSQDLLFHPPSFLLPSLDPDP